MKTQEESFKHLDKNALRCVNVGVCALAMGERLPTALSMSPSLEALFEIRFQAPRTAAGHLLPGILFSLLQNQYPDVVALPLARVSRDIRDSDPNFHCQPFHRQIGSNGSIQIGKKALALTAQMYPGWPEFKARAEQLLDAAREIELIKAVRRYSLNYIDFILSPNGHPNFPSTSAKTELKKAPTVDHRSQLRAELDDEDSMSIAKVMPNSMARIMGAQEIPASIIGIDTQKPNGKGNFFEEPH